MKFLTDLYILGFFSIKVLEQLKGDKTLDKFRQEYEKLHKALKKSHESEKRLMQKPGS